MRKISITLFLFLFTAACATSNSETIRDVRVLPQDARLYKTGIDTSQPIVSAEYQKKINEKYNRLYFAPWHKTRSSMSADLLASEFEKYREDPGYSHNLRKHSRDWSEKLEAAADLDNFPNTKRPAITIQATDLRVLPTLEPHYSDINKAGEGYPFDNLQNSSVPANAPIFVSHLTKDKTWAYVESPYASGWIPVQHLAYMNSDQIAEWEKTEQVAVTQRKLSIYEGEGKCLFSASLGSQFPYVGEDRMKYRVLAARSSENGNAILHETVIPKKAAVKKPLPLTEENIARLINQLKGQPYGWGGLYGERDCSATLMDLFAPFGLWLPRNSGDQARAGIFIDLESYEPKEKEMVIRKMGIPFLTLVWLKGHILLYVGERDDRAIVFHNFWGVRTKDLFGKPGRFVVGQAVFTTLEPGKELPNADRKNQMIKRVGGMTLLVPPKEVRQG